jgi:hypothetical protein
MFSGVVGGLHVCIVSVDRWWIILQAYKIPQAYTGLGMVGIFEGVGHSGIMKYRHGR